MDIQTNFRKNIETERLVLAFPDLVTFELAMEVYDAVEKSKDHLKRFLPWAWTMKSAEQEFLYLKDYADAGWEKQTGFVYLIRDKKTGTFLGVIDFMDVNLKDQSGEIGFWLKTDATGNGYMQEALRVLEEEIFRNGFHRIVIKNDIHNIKSINVTRNAGYYLEGVFRDSMFDEHTKTFHSLNVWSKINPLVPMQG